MKNKTLFVSAFGVALMGVTAINAQELVLPEGMEILTPENVEVTVSTARANDKDKALTIAGSAENGYKAYFTAKDAEHGEELWVSDGTKEGTKMVKDIYPGVTSSNVLYITRFNDKVVFQATANDDEGAELWISDGTEDGTYMIADINILGGSEPAGFTQINENEFIFGAKDYASISYGEEEQRWLWISDGTAEGTRLLKDCKVIYPGAKVATDDERFFVRVGRKVFFKADTKDNKFGEELWITDGTEAGTKMLLDINKTVANEETGATAGAQLDWFTNFKNEKLFFIAYSNEYGNETWVSDGTTEGTYMIKDLTEGTDANGLPAGHGAFTPRVYKDKVYFRGYDPYYGLELFVTDFTAEGTHIVFDLNTNPTATGTANGSPDLFCEFDGVLFMKGATGSDANLPETNFGLELFYTDGTAEGSKMQSDLNPGTGPNAAWEGIVVSGSFYFRAQDQTPAAGSSQAWELFKIDSKDEFPKKVVDLGEGPDFVHSLRNLDGDLVFTSQIKKSLFVYHYRKADYDPQKDKENMDPDFGETSAVMAPSSMDKTVDIYPNPASDYVCIDTDAEVYGYTITDLSGKLLVKGHADSNKIMLDDLSAGMFILSVETSEGVMNSKLTVK